MIRVAHPRLKRCEQLTDDDDCGVAHIVVHVAQPQIDRRLVRHRRDDNIITVLSHRCTEELEVNRRHLRRKNRVRLLTVLGEARALDGGHFVIGGILPARERGNQGAQADARRAEVRHLVQLYHRIDALVRLENLAHLRRRERVESAAKGAQLYHRHIRVLGDELRRVIEARVVAPLVDNLKAPLLHGDVIDRILGENRQLVGLDHLGDAVIDLGIDMIGTTCKQDGVLARLCNAVENLLTIVADVLTILLDLCIARINRSRNLLFSDALGLSELLHEALDHALAVVDRQERLDKADILLTQDIHVDADVLRIGGDNRAVEIICRRARLIVHIVRLAGVENRIDALLDEVDNMPVCELRGIAERVRRNRRHALVEELRRGFARDHDPIAEPVKEREPERIVLVHIERARNADAPATRLGG